MTMVTTITTDTSPRSSRFNRYFVISPFSHYMHNKGTEYLPSPYRAVVLVDLIEKDQKRPIFFAIPPPCGSMVSR